jgi:UDP:flavonoid glycosyltransferase YjiC (YdhE family)
MRGLPMIVAPIRDDQPVIARQVIDAGAALFMRHGKVTAATARTLIRSLLDTPALATNAQALGRTLREAPGTDGAAALVYELLSSARIPRRSAA